MEQKLVERMNRVIKRLGGPLALLDLPEEVKRPIVECRDYETRVKMLELVAKQLGK